MATRSHTVAAMPRPARPSDPKDYLDEHDVPFYLRDVISLLLTSRTERPLEFIAEYFTEILEGKNVLCREFEYINHSAHNRWSFILSAREAFADFDSAQLMPPSEFLLLLQLVCPDFPDRLVNDASKLCGHPQGPHALGLLLHATYACFFFSEFLHWTSTCFVRLPAAASRTKLSRLTRVVPPRAPHAVRGPLAAGCVRAGRVSDPWCGPPCSGRCDVRSGRAVRGR